MSPPNLSTLEALQKRIIEAIFRGQCTVLISTPPTFNTMFYFVNHTHHMSEIASLYPPMPTLCDASLICGVADCSVDQAKGAPLPFLDRPALFNHTSVAPQIAYPVPYRAYVEGATRNCGIPRIFSYFALLPPPPPFSTIPLSSTTHP